MDRLPLSIGCCNYDRTNAIFDGRARVDGCQVICSPIEPEEAFHRAFKFEEFDVTELSLSRYSSTVARGEQRYLGIPAFVSRLFRHSSVYVRTDRGIRSPADLRGKAIGVTDYQITANVWVRGILEDEYGVRPSDIRWRQGGLEDPGQSKQTAFSPPAGVEFQRIAKERTLSGLLETGELDGIIGARAPSCFLRRAPNIQRLFPDYRTTEAAYFAKTGIFPIMHIIGIRRSLAERHPWLPVNVYKAFLEAKRLCMSELGQISHLFTSLPWSVAEHDDAVRLMGEDFWSYGVEANEKALDTFLRYHNAQGLSPRRLAAAELFAPSTLDLSKS